MNLYLDTSAFLKLYLDEPESQRVRKCVSEAIMVCTHLITYAEMRASLAQAVRTNRLPGADLSYQVSQLESDWSNMDVVMTDEPLVRRAGNLAEQFGLRGYDSVHLAAAERVFSDLPAKTNFGFLAFDNDLQTAARSLRIAVVG